MNVQLPLKTRVYPPERLRDLSKAFEDSWTSIRTHPNVPPDGPRVDALRRTLALALFELYDRGLHDPGYLRDEALARLGFWSERGTHAPAR